MFKGVFIGDRTMEQERKILILGESHHWEKSDWDEQERSSEEAEEARRKKLENYTTEKVVNNYLNQYNGDGFRDKCYRFFDRIVQSFGIEPDRRNDLWDKVFFGNYIGDSLCGVGDNKAKNLIAKNRNSYNDELFKFIKNNKVDAVFCFSRRVYNALPNFEKDEKAVNKTQTIRTGTVGKKNDYISRCFYLPVTRSGKIHKLDKELIVYGMRHPSARGGYNSENYSSILSEAIKQYIVL